MIRQGLQLVHLSYPNQSYDEALAAPSNQQLQVHSVLGYNGHTSANDIGLGYTINKAHWKLWSIAASVTEVTSSIQAGTAVTLFGTVNNYGFFAQAKLPLEIISFDISQAQTGAPVYAYEYWNGSAWSALTLKAVPAYTSTGHMTIAFDAPVDWAVGANSLGPDESLYTVRIRATTAPTQAVKVDVLKTGKFICYRESVATKSAVEVNFETRQFLLNQGESIIAFFATAAAKNALEISYQFSP